MSLPIELQAARLRLVKERPYLAAALWALQPIERPGLGSLAVDQWWRLYYDPAVLSRCSVEELAGVLYHEVCHLLRDHASRMKDFDSHLANVCADAEINDDLIGEGVRLPGEPITPATIGQPEGLLAEEYYAALQRVQQPAPGQGASAQPGNGESQSTGAGEPEAGDTQQEDGGEAGQGQSASADRDGAATQGDGSASAPGSGAEDRPDPSSTAEGGGQADDAQPSSGGDAHGSKDGNASASQVGDAVESISASSSTQVGASSSQPGASSKPPAPSGSGRADGTKGTEPGDPVQTPAPTAGRCGSCATGQQEPWEDGPPGANTSPGISRAEAELIRRDVARQIKEHIAARGTVPGHWARWAEEKLCPKVDWRRELASAIRHAIFDVAGAVDYSYRRPSRRQGQVGNGKVIFPSLRCPVPSVAVVVDTSGSINDTMLSQALAEIAGILKSLGQKEGIHVLAVDAVVHDCRRVFRPEQVQLLGGGGTDMRKGLDAVQRLRPRPEVCVVITDGHTPWPDRPPQRMKVIIVLTGDGKSPEWARTVKIDRR